MPHLKTVAGLDAAVERSGNNMIVLDLYADWCAPCKQLSPTLDELALEFSGQARFFRVNVDSSKDLAAKFNTRGIPHIVFMKNGTVVTAITGLNPKDTYAQILSVCRGVGSADSCIAKVEALNK